MKKIRLSWIAVALALVVPAVAPATQPAKGAKPAPHEVATFSEVEFSEPMAWDCKVNQTCLECKNVSGAPSDVVVTHAPSGVEETHAVGANLEVRICDDVVFIPHSE